MRARPIQWELEQWLEHGYVLLESEQRFFEYEHEHYWADSY